MTYVAIIDMLYLIGIYNIASIAMCLGVIEIGALEFEIVCNSIFNKCHTIEACLRFSHFPQDQR